MTKNELIFIADILEDMKDSSEKEAKLLNAKRKKPDTAAYLKNEIIPRIEEACNIIQGEYFALKKLNKL